MQNPQNLAPDPALTARFPPSRRQKPAEARRCLPAACQLMGELASTLVPQSPINPS